MIEKPLLLFAIVSVAYAVAATFAYRADSKRGLVLCWTFFAVLLGFLAFEERVHSVFLETPISAYVLLSVLPTLLASSVIMLLGKTRFWGLQIGAGLLAFWIAVPISGALSYLAESLRP